MADPTYNHMIEVNAEFFAQEVCHTIYDMALVPYIVKKRNFDSKAIHKDDGVVVFIHFSGEIQGDFYLVMDEIVAGRLFGDETMGRTTEGVHQAREECGSLLMEVLNIAAGKTLVELEKHFYPLAVLPPAIVFGEAVFPDVTGGKVVIEGECGLITCALSINMATLKIGAKVNQKELEENVLKRTEQLEAKQREIAENARKAGMADVATRTLHNLGNILNSVKTSAGIISNTMRESAVENLMRANKLLSENIDNLEDFILNNPKGPKLMKYYLKLGEIFMAEKDKILVNTNRLMQKVDTICDEIASQQSYIGAQPYLEDVMPAEIIDEALSLHAQQIEESNVFVDKQFVYMAPISTQRAKLLDIFGHLFLNALEAMVQTPPDKRKLILNVDKEGESLLIKVTDSGCGIETENLKKIFSHGFSTNEKKHGFGLHSAANNMTEIGGKLYAESDGPGAGATFILSFPL